ncbi:DUF2993 domain-containing protein [Phormidium tenue FACHB-886]|nr:DUF2993 domain-containing protein [Phormidium tenue FACHB-886]
MTSSFQSGLISKVLSPAVRLWLRSQVDSIDQLEFQIEGGDRQILSGYIPGVVIAATRAVYQGIHLSEIALSAKEIRVNLGQVIKGNPLRLLAVVPVVGKAMISQADLNASLQAPLLADALNEVLLPLLRSSLSDTLPSGERLMGLQQPQVQIERDRLLLEAMLRFENKPPIAFALQTRLQIIAGSRLQFDHPEQLLPKQSKLPLLQGFEIDLGSDVQLRSLVLEAEKIFCEGQINVIP